MNKIKKFIKRLSPPSLASLKVLHIGLPVILISLTVLTFKLLLEDTSDYSKILFTYPESFARVLAFLAILILTAMIVDMRDKRK